MGNATFGLLELVAPQAVRVTGSRLIKNMIVAGRNLSCITFSVNDKLDHI